MMKAKLKLRTFLDQSNIALDLYGVSKDPNKEFNKTLIPCDDSLKIDLKVFFIELLKEQIIHEDVIYMTTEQDSGAQGTCLLLDLTKGYNPFKEFFKPDSSSNSWSENLHAFLVSLNLDEETWYIYQRIHPVSKLRTQRKILLERAEELNGYLRKQSKDLYVLERRIDIVFNEELAIVNKRAVLELDFGFLEHINNQAIVSIEKLRRISFIEEKDVQLLKSEMKKKKVAKRLFAAQTSPVLNLSVQDLMERLNKIKQYIKLMDANTLKIEGNIDLFLKMINDDVLKSDLTGTDYDAENKEKI